MAPGARSKFGAPMFEPEVFRKQMHCIEESACDIVRPLWGPHNHSAPRTVFQRPRVIWRPWNCTPRYAPADWTIMQRLKCYRCIRIFGAFIVVRRPGSCVPCPPWLLRAATRLNRAMLHSFNHRRTGALGLGREIFSSRPNFCDTLRKTNRRVLQGDGSAQATCSNISGKFLKSCPNLPPLPTPIALTQKLWQNTSYLQIGGLINWFYVVIKFFSQHLNICSPKLGEWLRLLPQPGYTSGNSYWWFWSFCCNWKPVGNSRWPRTQIWHG